MPPAARIGSAPSGGSGRPAAMWVRPQAATVIAPRPTPIRLVAAESSGARSRRRPSPRRTSGTAYPTRPTVPATTAWTPSPTAPWMPHHSRAATSTARAMRKKPTPSRRCSGSRSRADAPTRRTAPPARWLTPIQVPRTARSGSGRPPERALVVRPAGLRAGARLPARELAGRVDPVPDPAREAREGVVEGRVAMGERYPSGPIRPRRHTGDRQVVRSAAFAARGPLRLVASRRRTAGSPAPGPARPQDACPSTPAGRSTTLLRRPATPRGPRSPVPRSRAVASGTALAAGAALPPGSPPRPAPSTATATTASAVAVPAGPSRSGR